MVPFSRAILSFLLMICLAPAGRAELTAAQRLADFQSIVSLYSKRYAPYVWKQQALGFNMFDTAPWETRIRAAKDDLEYLEILAEYVAGLQDTHSSFLLQSTFSATLGFTLDIYDGKVLVDGISRAVLPTALYPFQIGDELVSLDGKTAEEWITLFSKYRQWGNPVSTRRSNAAQITARTQNVYPRAHEIGESALVTIRRANGELEEYDVPWTKSGEPRTEIPAGRFATAQQSDEAPVTRDPRAALAEMHNWALPSTDLALSHIPGTADEEGNERSFVLGLGSRTPVFRLGLPTNFITRRGLLSSDIHFSGTFQAGGRTIGYLRIPTFSPSSSAQAVAELNTEINFFQQNTDGLVVDVMRNSGGGCYMLDATARLIPRPFYFFGEQLMVTQSQINNIQSWLEFSELVGLDQWIIDTYRVYLTAMRDAYKVSGALTGPIPTCTQLNSLWAPVQFGNPPATPVYTKPIITLIDEFSISAADIFPAMLQDNGRGVLVGTRTAGGGGSVSSWPAGIFSETYVSNTNTLVVRRNPVATTDLPAAAYIENIGTRPDVELNYMTRENLLANGRPFVTQFTQIILDEIRKAQPQSDVPSEAAQE